MGTFILSSDLGWNLISISPFAASRALASLTHPTPRDAEFNRPRSRETQQRKRLVRIRTSAFLDAA